MFFLVGLDQNGHTDTNIIKLYQYLLLALVSVSVISVNKSAMPPFSIVSYASHKKARLANLLASYASLLPIQLASTMLCQAQSKLRLVKQA